MSKDIQRLAEVGEQHMLETLTSILKELTFGLKNRAMRTEDSWRYTFESNVYSYREARRLAASCGLNMSGFDKTVGNLTWQYFLLTKTNSFAITSRELQKRLINYIKQSE